MQAEEGHFTIAQLSLSPKIAIAAVLIVDLLVMWVTEGAVIPLVLLLCQGALVVAWRMMTRILASGTLHWHSCGQQTAEARALIDSYLTNIV